MDLIKAYELIQSLVRVLIRTALLKVRTQYLPLLVGKCDENTNIRDINLRIVCFEGVSALKRSAFLQWCPTSTLLQSWEGGGAGSIGAGRTSIPLPNI